MHHFEYKNGALYAEDVDLTLMAETAGTPTYVYSEATLRRHFTAFSSAFEGTDHLVCYAVKANSNRAVMNLFGSMGAGADIVSGGEMIRAMQASIPAQRIVYSGVGKSEAEIAEALEVGILMFNLESIQELEVINKIAGTMGVKAPVSFRVNPDVDAQTHPKITTGLAKNKFGLDVDSVFGQYMAANELEHVEVKGVSCHIGSQLTKVSPFADALERLAELIGKLRAAGIELSLLDMGGGLGITYNQEEPPSPAEYAGALKDTVNRLGMRLILEPGRVLVGNAGILLAKVLYTKSTTAKNFVVVDAGMNDLMRPTMYDSHHDILPVAQPENGDSLVVDVVGPICETGDFLARDRELAELKRGDLIAVMSAGAYGFAMSSNYNSRPRAAEVMVSGERWAVVRNRETIEDVTQGEKLPPWLG